MITILEIHYDNYSPPQLLFNGIVMTRENIEKLKETLAEYERLTDAHYRVQAGV